ncbi:MAG: RNB domain-containing ribonuclease, partial [Desulfuromonadaceae bacterium]|nr:RNB domain-containing ribonuclease [Desulfuromonadaceae bacterium]
MRQARYSADNVGHFGLASDCYCHFTSPIRRYPDLVVHRILKAALASTAEKGREGKRASEQLAIASERLAEVAEHTSKRERVAMEAERDVVEMKKLQYMQQHVGEKFDGYITGVTNFGFFVELEELFVEGLVHISTLNDDMYTHAEKQHSLIGRRTGTVFRIGDAVQVIVTSVSPGTRRIEFTLAAHIASPPTPVKGTWTAGTEEYPRIPLRGKRLASLQPRAETGEQGSRGSRSGKGRGGTRKRR